MSARTDVIRTQLENFLRNHAVIPDDGWTDSQLMHAIRRLLIPEERDKNELVAVMIDALKHVDTPPSMPPMIAELFRNAVGGMAGSMTRRLIDTFADAVAKGEIPGKAAN